MKFWPFYGYKGHFWNSKAEKVNFRSSKVQIMWNMTNFEAYRSLKCPIMLDAGPSNVMLKRWKNEGWAYLEWNI